MCIKNANCYKKLNCYNFEIAERLRTLRYLIFTGGVVTEGVISVAHLRRKTCGYARGSLSEGAVKAVRL